MGLPAVMTEDFHADIGIAFSEASILFQMYAFQPSFLRLILYEDTNVKLIYMQPNISGKSLILRLY